MAGSLARDIPSGRNFRNKTPQTTSMSRKGESPVEVCFRDCKASETRRKQSPEKTPEGWRRRRGPSLLCSQEYVCLFVQSECGRCAPPKSQYLGMRPIAKKLERSKVAKHSAKRRAKVPEAVVRPTIPGDHAVCVTFGFPPKRGSKRWGDFAE